MIYFRAEDPDLMPRYMSVHASGADIRAAEDLSLAPGAIAKVRSGLWIDRVAAADQIPPGTLPEIQVRARSGLAAKGIGLANGVGTIDIDFPDEICVLLHNFSSSEFTIRRGDRIAQLVLALTHRFPELDAFGKRQGGFGSTGLTERL